jgi:glyoxylase-like metal-dependent hydrolase (beta-lactamase superfamily II)
LAELRKLTEAKVAVSCRESPREIAESARIIPNKKAFSPERQSIDIMLDGGEVFPVLGGLQVVPTPGHTAGSISLYTTQKNILFAADALDKRRGILRLPLKTVTTDISQAIASIEKRAQLDIDIICFGHGNPITEEAKGRLGRLLEKVKH